jgi:hypothetical protein
MMARWKRGLGAALVALALVLAPGAAAEEGATVRLSPATVAVGEGLTAAVDVRVEGVEALYGLDIRLEFDPTAVAVVDADPATAGVQVRPGELLALDMVARNVADNEAGTVWFAMTQVNPSPEVSGSGVALSLTLQGTRAGAESALSVSYAKLASRGGLEIPATCVGGVVRVVEAASAPATPSPAAPPARPALEQTAAAPRPAAPPLAEAPGQGQLRLGVEAAVLAALAGGLTVLALDWWRRRERP